MNIRLKLGSVLLIFVTSMANVFAANLTITKDGTAVGGNIEVYDISQTLRGTCSFPTGCDSSLSTLEPGNYTIISIPASFTTDVTSGFSVCPGAAILGEANVCNINLTVTATVTATFNVRNRFEIYDQDADGIDDLTEFALDRNPLAFDDYTDTDNDGLHDIIETQVTHTDINVNDSSTCSGTPPDTGDDLTGQWDVRWIENIPEFAGHDLNDTDDVDSINVKKEWLTAFSICHTNSGLKVFDQYLGYASTATFNGSTINLVFNEPEDGETVINASYVSGGGEYTQGRFQDLNATNSSADPEGIGSMQLRADRRMTKSDLALLTAANISGTIAVQGTAYPYDSDLPLIGLITQVLLQLIFVQPKIQVRL